MEPWILIVTFAVNGTGFSMQEFGSLEACMSALVWSGQASTQRQGYPLKMVCINKNTGEKKTLRD